jgi:hypothetical protein
MSRPQEVLDVMRSPDCPACLEPKHRRCEGVCDKTRNCQWCEAHLSMWVRE